MTKHGFTQTERGIARRMPATALVISLEREAARQRHVLAKAEEAIAAQREADTDIEALMSEPGIAA